MPLTLVLLRHGESEWNAANLFTGWYDSDLSEKGRTEAITSGRLLKQEGLVPDVLHTSTLVRAIRTADLALDEAGLLWLPVTRHWRLNERHYGGLTGKNKKETAEQFGADQVKIWRRSYDIPPPPVDTDSPYHPVNDPRYKHLPPEVLPASECLKDVLVRMLPWWHDVCIPDLDAGRVVLVSAHGNSLRALVKHLDEIPDDEIAELNIPTGVPLVYELDAHYRPVTVGGRYLDPAAAAAGAAAVAAQAG
jgi:2,3-bisphosphoglycerate-dependent phosphoglycerate mutase